MSSRWSVNVQDTLSVPMHEKVTLHVPLNCVKAAVGIKSHIQWQSTKKHVLLINLLLFYLFVDCCQRTKGRSQNHRNGDLQPLQERSRRFCGKRSGMGPGCSRLLDNEASHSGCRGRGSSCHDDKREQPAIYRGSICWLDRRTRWMGRFPFELPSKFQIELIM